MKHDFADFTKEGKEKQKMDPSGQIDQPQRMAADAQPEEVVFCVDHIRRIHNGALTINLHRLLSNIIVWTLAAQRFERAARSLNFQRAFATQHYVSEFFHAFLGEVINVRGLKCSHFRSN